MGDIIVLLQLNKFYGSNQLIEMVKGSYELPTYKNILRKIYRKIKSK